MNDSDNTPETNVAETLTREEWDEIARRLREPFDPSEVDFRAQGKASEQTGKAQVVAYVDARVVQDRLDSVVGVGNWSFDWQPLVIDKGEVMVTKGTLTIFGVSKADAGSASNFEQSLGAVSHCFKRAAVHWGIGRYLYNLPMSWVAVERGGRIPAQVLRDLRGQLPRPGHVPTNLHAVEDERPMRAVRESAASATRPAPAQTNDASPNSASSSTSQLDDTAANAPWTTYLNNMPFRNRCKALGYLSVAQVEELVAAACGAGQPVTKAKVQEHLVALEAQAKAAAQQSSGDLHGAFTGGRPS